ncbi:MAG TPA: prenyltransferase/squalene oxidase repeat-containing protein [Gemmataceae bacterium]|nr:prenyltransferase/squalene oxidase repeat-containing protein [Gemmataceae bacterium]
MKINVCACVAAFTIAGSAARADGPPTDAAETVRKGLEWLARQQDRTDGHFAANTGQYPTSMTSLAGLCFLQEGSTLREGRYSPQIRKAVEWFLKRSQPNGLLGNPNNPTEANHYMHGHGYALLFLSCVYGEEEDEKRRADLEKLLMKAVEFSGLAQTSMGGWGYVSAKENGDWDEGSVTITQVQALRAARNAGIVVPKSIIDKAVKYLADCTNDDGGVRYEYRRAGPSSPALTAAALACGFSAGDYSSPLAKKWISYLLRTVPGGQKGMHRHDEYTNYYLAQAVYVLGDDRYGQMFPGTPPTAGLRWSAFRQHLFPYLRSTQAADGSWQGSHVGPVFGTTTALTILQLENNTLPIYQR